MTLTALRSTHFAQLESAAPVERISMDNCRQVSRNFTNQSFSIGTFLPIDFDQYRLLLFISLLTWHATHLQDTMLMTQHKEKVTIYLSNRCLHCVFLRAYYSHGTAWINSTTSVDNFQMTEINVFLLRRHRVLVSSCMNQTMIHDMAGCPLLFTTRHCLFVCVLFNSAKMLN